MRRRRTTTMTMRRRRGGEDDEEKLLQAGAEASETHILREIQKSRKDYEFVGLPVVARTRKVGPGPTFRFDVYRFTDLRVYPPPRAFLDPSGANGCTRQAKRLLFLHHRIRPPSPSPVSAPSYHHSHAPRLQIIFIITITSNHPHRHHHHHP